MSSLQTEIWIAVAALFAGLALTASVATLIYTQSLLKRCFDILDFVLFTDEEALVCRLEQEIQHKEDNND